MKNFIKIMEGMDTAMLLQQLAHNKDLWDQNKFRTTYKNTPHVDIHDIYLRYANVFEKKETGAVLRDTSPIWYSPITFLSHAKPLVLDLMRKVEGYSLERCLITKLEPKGRINPHADNAGEYVNQGDIARYHIVLNGKPGSWFRCGDERVDMLTGEVWWFNALEEHEVQNDSDDERIHLIADIRFMP